MTYDLCGAYKILFCSQQKKKKKVEREREREINRAMYFNKVKQNELHALSLKVRVEVPRSSLSDRRKEIRSRAL